MIVVPSTPRCECHPAPDRQWGAVDDEGSWSGMVGEMVAAIWWRVILTVSPQETMRPSTSEILFLTFGFFTSQSEKRHKRLFLAR